MSALSVAMALSLASTVLGAAMMTAPQRCPLQNGNLLDVDLFVASEEQCQMTCEKHEKCFFYFFYTAPTKNRQPPQCFLYETCDRLVETALEDCPIGRENTIGVMAFMEKEEDCIISCSKNEMCSFYKYYSAEDEKKPMMCYHLRSCVPKLVKRSECPLEKNNYIDHRLFVQSDRDCRQFCEDTADCRFYYWFPIDYSPSPLYCYLFRRECAPKAKGQRTKKQFSHRPAPVCLRSVKHAAPRSAAVWHGLGQPRPITRPRLRVLMSGTTA